MTSLSNIKDNVDQMLKSATGYKVYGREIKEGLSRPCFLVELLTTGSDDETQNYSSNKLTVIITYFQKQYQEKGYSDSENIKMYDSLRSLFRLNLPVGNRVLHPQNFRMNYMGENSDILQVSFDLNYFDSTGRTRDTEPVASDIYINLKL